MVYKRHWDLHDDGSFRDSGKGSVALHKLKKYKRHLTGELGRDQCRVIRHLRKLLLIAKDDVIIYAFMIFRRGNSRGRFHIWIFELWLDQHIRRYLLSSSAIL